MKLEQKLKKIDQLKMEVDLQSQPNKLWDRDFLEKIKLDFTYASNRLEGNRLNYGQTLQILRDFVTPHNVIYADVLDVVNHKRVLDIVFENYHEQEISEINIKRLHKELMKNPAQWTDGIHYDPGNYKIIDNHTYRSTGKQHSYIEAANVTMAMRLLLKTTNDSLNQQSHKAQASEILKIANTFHYTFLNKIHPFGDGNGRIARIFMNLILLKNELPPIFIKEVDKTAYLECFEAEEKHSGTMLEFMADRLIESFDLRYNP